MTERNRENKKGKGSISHTSNFVDSDEEKSIRQVTQIDGIGQHKFNEIVSLFSDPSISSTAYLRSNKKRSEILGICDDTVQQSKNESFESKSFKSRIDMWKNKIDKCNHSNNVSSGVIKRADDPLDSKDMSKIDTLISENNKKDSNIITDRSVSEQHKGSTKKTSIDNVSESKTTKQEKHKGTVKVEDSSKNIVITKKKHNEQKPKNKNPSVDESEESNVEEQVVPQIKKTIRVIKSEPLTEEKEKKKNNTVTKKKPPKEPTDSDDDFDPFAIA